MKMTPSPPQLKTRGKEESQLIVPTSPSVPKMNLFGDENDENDDVAASQFGFNNTNDDELRIQTPQTNKKSKWGIVIEEEGLNNDEFDDENLSSCCVNLFSEPQGDGMKTKETSAGQGTSRTLGSKRSWEEQEDSDASSSGMNFNVHNGLSTPSSINYNSERMMKVFRSADKAIHRDISMESIGSLSLSRNRTQKNQEVDESTHSKPLFSIWSAAPSSAASSSSNIEKQSRQTQNIKTPSRSPQSMPSSNSPFCKLLLPTLGRNSHDHDLESRDDFVLGETHNKNNANNDQDSKTNIMSNDEENVIELGEKDSKLVLMEDDNKTSINQLTSPPKRKFNLGPRKQRPMDDSDHSNDTVQNPLNGVSTRLFCPGPPLENHQNTEDDDHSHLERSPKRHSPSKDNQFIFSDISMVSKAATPGQFSFTPKTPKSVPNAVYHHQTPSNTNISNMMTYQSPAWSQCVTINPFSPVPKEYLVDCNSTMSQSNYSPHFSPTSRNQSQQQKNWNASPDTPSFTLNQSNDSILEFQEKMSSVASITRKYSPMDVSNFPQPPTTPYKRQASVPRRHKYSYTASTNPSKAPICPQAPKRYSTTPVPEIHPSCSFESSSSTWSRFENDFQTISTLGSGSFGTVLKCISRLDGCFYAIKTTTRSMRGNFEKHRYLKEVHALSALCNQPEKGTFHIVRYHQAWIEDGHLYIQTELCDQGTLMQHLKSGETLSEDERWQLLREILLALELVHLSGMVHLDIKPDNIFIKNNHYKLGDFGLASTTSNVENDIEEGDARYMPRELLDDNNCSLDLTKCDIFSLGVTMYEVCRGHPVPCDGQEWQDLRSSKFSPLIDTSYEMQEVIKEMMHPDPNRRPSASELLRRPQLLSDKEKKFRLMMEKVKNSKNESNHKTTNVQKMRRSRSFSF